MYYIYILGFIQSSVKLFFKFYRKTPANFFFPTHIWDYYISPKSSPCLQSGLILQSFLSIP